MVLGITLFQRVRDAARYAYFLKRLFHGRTTRPSGLHLSALNRLARVVSCKLLRDSSYLSESVTSHNSLKHFFVISVMCFDKFGVAHRYHYGGDHLERKTRDLDRI